MSINDYARRVLAEGVLRDEALAQLPDDVSGFMRENFDLTMYPSDWILSFGRKLASFRVGAADRTADSKE